MHRVQVRHPGRHSWCRRCCERGRLSCTLLVLIDDAVVVLLVLLVLLLVGLLLLLGWLLLVYRPLLNDLVGVGSFDHANLAEVAEEVGPHDMVLVDVGALNLRHRDEVVCQELAVVLADAAHFRQALVAVEEKLLPLML